MSGREMLENISRVIKSNEEKQRKIKFDQVNQM